MVAVGIGATPSAASDSYEKMTTFGCLGVPQDFVVPKGATSIYASVTGASGGGDRGGRGGEVISTIKVTPGELLSVTVGCRESAYRATPPTVAGTDTRPEVTAVRGTSRPARPAAVERAPCGSVASTSLSPGAAAGKEPTTSATAGPAATPA